MPTTIVTDSCPAPEFNLTQRDVEQCVPELEAYLKEFESGFGRIEQFRQSQVYLKGLLSDLQRKTAERIALEVGENVRDLQHFVGQSPWGIEPGGGSVGRRRWGSADRRVGGGQTGRGFGRRWAAILWRGG